MSPKTTTSWRWSPCRCQLRSTPSRRKPARSSATCERPLRVFAHAVRRSKPSCSNASAAISAFDSPFAPLPQNSRAEPRADGGVAVAARELRQAGDADRPVLAMVDQEVEQLAALALARVRGDIGLGLGDLRVRAPAEPAGHGRVGGQLEQARRVLGGGVAEGQRRAGEHELGHRADTYVPVLACLYDVHGNLPALEAVLADAGAQGARRFVLGGDYALFGAWPARRSRGCASSSPRSGSAATASAGPPTRAARPTTRSCRARSRPAPRRSARWPASSPRCRSRARTRAC